MKENHSYKVLKTLLPIFGLMLLLLLSPCNVRNYIQSELGVPQTDVSNKSKITLENASCTSFDVNSITLKTYRFDFEKKVVLPANVSLSNRKLVVFIKNSTHFNPNSNVSHNLIPLYILFKNRKVYLG